MVTDSLGRYEFMTIKPGAYPWGNHHNAWRPAHIHFSLFGRAFTQRLVTQMYFPDDPLFGQDPIFNAIPAAGAAPGDQPLLPRAHAGQLGAGLRVGHRARAAPTRRRSRPRTTETWRDDASNPLDVPDVTEPYQPRSGQRGTGFLTDPFRLGPTPSATVGPYLAIGLTWPDGAWAAAEGTEGGILDPRPRVRRRRRPRPRRDGRDLAGRPGRRLPVAGGPARRGVLPGFRGYARVADRRAAGEFGVFTLKPGRVPDGEGGLQAPHIDVSVFARGMLDRVVTRIYFADEAEANAEDVVLRGLPDDAARGR